MSKGSQACGICGLTRWAAGLALVAALAPAQGIRAQPGNTFALSLPSATLAAAKIEFESGGLSWDAVRKGGLSLTVAGAGEFNVSVAAIAVSRGRVLRTWKSSGQMQVASGTVTLAGRTFVPDDRFLQGIPRVLGHQAGAALPVADAIRAIDEGSVKALLDRTTASSGSGVLLVALPGSATSRTSTTSGRFLRTETFGD
ncbi:MAG: hypothetical protein AB7H81_10075 [Vicinamibacterales bacterium]